LKNITEVIAKFNELVKTSPLSNFYARRAKIRGISTRNRDLIIRKGKDSNDFAGYGFHWGGRDELQFNLGFDEDSFFRYGVAISLESGQDLPDPVNALTPSINSLNTVISNNPRLFSGFSISYHYSDKRIHEKQVRLIPKEWIKKQSFIFIGERVKLGSKGVDEKLLRRAVEVMSALLPVYELTETYRRNLKSATSIQSDTKIARICWNTNMWQKPSGLGDKSKNKKAYENINKFGHEEWLLDTTKTVDGWKYGFIQALNHSHKSVVGKRLNLVLFTINGSSRSRYWIAKLRDIEVLTAELANKAIDIYRKKGWLKEMKSQLSEFGISPKHLDAKNPLFLVNVRYRVEDLEIFHEPILVDAKTIPSSYYGTLQKLPDSQKELGSESFDESKLREKNDTKMTSRRKTYASEKEIDLVHKQWQKRLKINLTKEFPTAEVLVETCTGNSIDVQIESNGNKLFIELKTDNVVKQVIRSALGQLLEYSYRKPLAGNAKILVIVGSAEATYDDQSYVEMLRKQFKLPIHYRRYKDGSIIDLKSLVDQL